MDVMKQDKVNIFVYILVICFGMGSWIAVNGMWAELPVLVNELPEGWNLPSYMSIIIQLANIGPLLYTVLNKCCPRRVNEKMVVYLIVTIAAVALILLIFFWKRTSYIGNVEHSTALLVLLLFVSIADCTSTVVFLPFMSIFKPRYITALYFGESLSGMVPSFVALGQGVGKTKCINTTVTDLTTNQTKYQIKSQYLSPNFPVEDFFIFLACMMALCGISFTLLCRLPISKQEQIVPSKPRKENHTNSTPLLDNENKQERQISHQDEIDNSQNTETGSRNSTKKLSDFQYIYLLCVVAWINGIANGILPQIQSYACLPYGNEPYHLAVNFSNIASPAACLLSFWLTVLSPTAISGLAAVGTGVSVYVMILASQSPYPLLAGTTIGDILVVTASVIIPFLLTFAKVSSASVFRLCGKKALLWCGIVTQVGSTLGTIVMFVSINVFKVFHEKNPCS